MLALLASTGRNLVTTAVVAAAVAAVAVGLYAVVSRGEEDAATRFHLRRATRYTATLVFLVGLVVVWKPLAGRVGLIVGLFAAGIGFALQEVIGSLFGWVNILSGRIFRVGDRISMAGVEGDVIDLTPLRTKILEMGTPVELGTGNEGSPPWVRGRQYTGRIVSVSNNATFTSPVYNYSAVFEYIWEELTLPVAYRSDWHEAERILLEEVRAVSASDAAERAMEEMTRRYPVPRTEVEPRVFVRATDNWMELAARFVVPVRLARATKSDLTRRIRDRFDEAGIEIASETSDLAVRFPDAPPPE